MSKLWDHAETMAEAALHLGASETEVQQALAGSDVGVTVAALVRAANVEDEAGFIRSTASGPPPP
jgi:hypothetical protein